MKTKGGILLIVFISILLITYSKVDMKIEEESYVQKKALIMPEGKLIDTAFLHSVYRDYGARINEWDRVPICAYRLAYATGTVNTEVLGTYYVDYDGEDADGNALATVTRTVHVVENNAAFLNGIYNVTCTCKSVDDTIVTTSKYIAAVSSGSVNNSFILDKLEIGSGITRPYSLGLKDSTIKIAVNNCDFGSTGSVTGKLSTSKNSFTIETQVFQLYPSGNYMAKYYCKNVFKNSAKSFDEEFK